MAAKPLSLPNVQDPPSLLVQRKARVGVNGPNTLRVPTDSAKDETNLWFKSPPGDLNAQGNPMQPIQKGIEVKYMIDGGSTFQEMTDAMDTATGQNANGILGADHFIYMLNWFANDDFELRIDVPSGGPTPPGGKLQCNSCLHLKLNQADANNVMVRAMFWDQAVSTQNTSAVANIKALKNGAAVLDARGNASLAVVIPLQFGSQHQKILLISGELGLIAFVGGIDFNPDRLNPPTPDPSQLANPGAPVDPFQRPFVVSGNPLHDVHARVRGPAAADLLQIFIQRWNDHPEGQRQNRPPALGGKGPLKTLKALPPQVGPHTVQIGRTFGRVGAAAVGDLPYGFAPGGERTAREIILKAIRNAKKYLYTEDQYFIGNPDLEAALISTLKKPTFQHLTVVLTHFKISDLPAVHQHRRDFIQRLINADPGNAKKIRIFFLRGDDTQPQSVFDAGNEPNTYVHAKIWIADDEFAAIGSVNSNRRSWSHDSEVVAGIYDLGSDVVLKYRLAHMLRIEIWQAHLNMPGAQGAAELSDPVASSVHWLSRPLGARVKPYDINEPGDHFITTPVPLINPIFVPLTAAIFDSIIDPA